MPAPAEFVERLSAAWAGPKDERFFARVLPLMSDRIRLVQPLVAPAHGHRGLRRVFGALFVLVPDLRGQIVAWSVRGERIDVEFVLTGTLGARPLRLRSHDRFLMRDGHAHARVSSFDARALVWAVLSRPRAWPRALRSALVLRRGAGPAPARAGGVPSTAP